MFNWGYGAFWLNGQNHTAHKVAYEWEHGAVPEGKQLDHLCRIRRCIRPSHQEPVTCQVNLLRGETLAADNAAKTHCHRGHAFTEENTRYDKRGNRLCRACGNLRTKASYRRKRASMGLMVTERDPNKPSYQKPIRPLRNPNHLAHLHPEIRQGEQNGRAKITQEKADQIRQICTDSKVNKTAVAKQFGIGRSTLGHILKGESWNYSATQTRSMDVVKAFFER